MSAIDALYIYDEHNTLILDHVYGRHPPSASTVLQLYLQQPSPRPNFIYLPTTSPPTLLFWIIQDSLLFVAPCSYEIEPLLVLEFLHRVTDALEEFLGSPLLASKITSNYDVVAQVITEMADAGVVCHTEANALRDVVETGPGVLQNFLGGVGLPNTIPTLQAGPPVALQRPSLQTPQSAQGSAVPWRRNNVRHTSNELYVDIVESLSVTIAPSGRPLAAFANGSIAFTCKVSGVPDLLLTLTTSGKGSGMGNRGDQLRNVMEHTVFHPCVRLNRWKTEGVLSFIPPDGRFALCGYETDLLGPDSPLTTNQVSSNNLNLPASLEISTGLGADGNDFEVRVIPSSALSSSMNSAAAASLQSNLSRTAAFKSGTTGDSKAPAFEALTVHVPIPPSVRNITDLRPSKGEAQWNPADGVVEWKIPGKDLGPGSALLRCSVRGPVADAEDVPSSGVMNGMTATTYDYDDDQPAAYQDESSDGKSSSATPAGHMSGMGDRRSERSRDCMPTSATLSFAVKGLLASGLKVDSLVLDTKKSRGLGPDVRPYKGVKYLTVSKQGVEVRC